MVTIAAQGVKRAGAWFDHHRKMADDSWDFEICVPVSDPIVAADRMKPSQRPGMKLAQTVYHGPYRRLRVGLGQCCVVGPESSPDRPIGVNQTAGELRLSTRALSEPNDRKAPSMTARPYKSPRSAA
jgi:hypothetical protein